MLLLPLLLLMMIKVGLVEAGEEPLLFPQSLKQLQFTTCDVVHIE